uniref:Uncharacterized protein n=1 Tax=Eptatretus burgeri TaxID=7764 RepID=A0A8C4NMU3_EPTBU
CNPTKDWGSLDASVQSVLSCLYPPFELTAPTVLSQVLAVWERDFAADGLQYLVSFLIPAKHLLQCVQQAACSNYPGFLFRHEGWPLCLGPLIAVHLAELDPRALRPRDFYLQVSGNLCQFLALGQIRLGIFLQLCTHLKVPIPEELCTAIFTMEFLHDVSAERGGSPLESCILAGSDGLHRMTWKELVTPEFVDCPRISGEGEPQTVKPSNGRALFERTVEQLKDKNCTLEEEVFSSPETLAHCTVASDSMKKTYWHRDHFSTPKEEEIVSNDFAVMDVIQTRGLSDASVILQNEDDTANSKLLCESVMEGSKVLPTSGESSKTSCSEKGNPQVFHTTTLTSSPYSDTGQCCSNEDYVEMLPLPGSSCFCHQCTTLESQVKLCERNNSSDDTSGELSDAFFSRDICNTVSDDNHTFGTVSHSEALQNTGKTHSDLHHERGTEREFVDTRLFPRDFGNLTDSGSPPSFDVDTQRSRDRTGRALVIISTRSPVWSSPRCTGLQVAQLLLYYHSLPRKEGAGQGLVVLMDARRCRPKPTLFKAFAILQVTDFELITSLKSLHKHVESSQLPPTLNGSFNYSHEDWVEFRLVSAAFYASADEVEVQVKKEEHDGMMRSVLSDLRLVCLQREGGATLSRLRREQQAHLIFDDCRYVTILLRLWGRWRNLMGNLGLNRVVWSVDRVGGISISKLLHLASEMLLSEREYVRALDYIMHNFISELDRADAPAELRGRQSMLFGNLHKLWEFHGQYFLHELETCTNCPLRIGSCFLHYKQFEMYALYSKNKPSQKQLALGDKMDLSSYLLKPIQRMSKYALLLKDMIKQWTGQMDSAVHTAHPAAEQELEDLRTALELIRFQLRHGNDLLAMDSICNCDVNLKEQGQLLRQDEFLVSIGRRKQCRRVFLFHELILFSKTKRADAGHDIYVYKKSFKTAELGMTESVGDSGLCFELWFRRRKSNDTHTLQAASPDLKDSWTNDISHILWKQALRNRQARLQELVSMGIGNKPYHDISPSSEAISNRAIDLFAKGRGIFIITSDPFKRPHSTISSSSTTSSSSGSQVSAASQLSSLNMHFQSSHISFGPPSAWTTPLQSPARSSDFHPCIEEEIEQDSSSQPSMGMFKLILHFHSLFFING